MENFSSKIITNLGETMDIKVQKTVRYDQKRFSPRHIIVKQWKRSGQSKKIKICKKKVPSYI
jgi:hypothetical protein